MISPAARAASSAITSVLALAIVSPLVRDRAWDSFPVSSYPMFSRGDVGSVVSLGHVVLVQRDGSRRPAAPSLVGTPEPMVAKNLVEHAIASGDGEALCARIAARARDEARGAEAVEIVSSVFDSRRYFRSPEGRAPITREVHATCRVHR